MRKKCSSHSFRLEDTQGALVLTEESLQLYVPKEVPGDVTPDHILILTAIAMLLREDNEALKDLIRNKLDEMHREYFPSHANVSIQ